MTKSATHNLLRFRLTDNVRDGEQIDLEHGDPVAIAFGANALYVGVRRGGGERGHILKIDPATDRVTDSFPIADDVQDVAVGDGIVWVANRGARSVVALHVSDRSQQRYVLPGKPTRIAYGHGALWVTIRATDEVVRVIPGRPSVTIRVGSKPMGVAASDTVVWVADQGQGTLTRIDPRTAKVVGEPVQTQIGPTSVALAGHTVWAANISQNSVTRVDF